ncbi:MAG: ISAs1 family transposase [Acidobacteria bacterium]|nr:ISAs1 family transposase [Acidobacteriota bacterium]
MAQLQEAPQVLTLGQVGVRLIEPCERERFDRLLIEKHYLHSARIGGRSLRYVAEFNGEWVALLCFSGAAPHVKAREKWIGWSVRQRARRLGFVVNHSRFLLLTDRQVYPNLASRVLGLALKRLAIDWPQQWGQPVLLVESFVDESQYRGTCYRACGFAAVGLTAGYGRSSRDYYLKHDQPKQLFLRPLRPDAAAVLRRGRLPAALVGHEEDTSGPCSLRAEALGSLLEVFQALGEPCRGHGLRHPQSFVLACATVGMLMGAGGYAAMEDQCGKLNQRQLRALGCRYDEKTQRYRPPSDTTFFRVINRVEPVAFDRIVGQWMMGREISILERLAVDGKTLRGSGRTDGKALQLLSAVTHRLRLTVAQLAIAEKSNEIPAYQPLLETVPRLEGSIVTADAMQCQQEAARYTTQERGADYLFGLKGNQAGILERATLKLPREFFSP